MPGQGERFDGWRVGNGLSVEEERKREKECVQRGRGGALILSESPRRKRDGLCRTLVSWRRFSHESCLSSL